MIWPEKSSNNMKNSLMEGYPTIKLIKADPDKEIINEEGYRSMVG